MAKNILFVCATGIATSTAVANKVMDYLRDNGVTGVTYHQTNVASLNANSDDADLIVSTTSVPYELNIPVISGLPLITGIREEKVLKEILEEVQKGE